MSAQPELKFQKELVISTNKEGGYGEIMAQKFKKGFPDVILHHPEFVDTSFIECKYFDKSSKARTADVPIDLTELQRHTLKKMRKAGMRVAVLVQVTVDKKEPRVYTIGDLDKKYFSMAEDSEAPIGKENGRYIWDIEKLMYNIAEAEHGE